MNLNSHGVVVINYNFLLTLELVVAGVDITSSDSKFVVYPAPSITVVRPSAVRAEGGSTITIHGANFGNTESVFCRFGNTKTARATWLADSLLECVAPEGRPGPVQVDVTLNGVDYTNSEQTIMYVTDTTIANAAPLRGSALGGTVVDVVGSGLISPGSMFPPVCLFGDIRVKAHEYNLTHASCRSPVLPPDMANRLSSTLAVPFKIMNSDLLRTATDYTMSINGNAVAAKNDDVQLQFVATD